MKKNIALTAGIVVLVIAVAGAVGWQQFGPQKNPDPNHTHADFAVWINGVQWDFSQEKYMSTAPDAAPAEESFFIIPKAQAHLGEEVEEHDVVENPRRKYLHLHDGNGHVIHRHKPGLTLGDFFKSIDWKMENVCMQTDTGERQCNESGDFKWRMFVNGTEQLMNPYFVFEDGDQILLTYGSTKEEIVGQIEQLTSDACRYSQTCPWKGRPPTENCIADPAVPCVQE